MSKASSRLDLEHLLCSLAEEQNVVVVMSYDGGTIMMEFAGAACNGLRIGCLEVDAKQNYATRVAERLAIEAEVGLDRLRRTGSEIRPAVLPARRSEQCQGHR